MTASARSCGADSPGGLGGVGRRLRRAARAVDDRVAGDRVEPGRAGAARRVVARRRAPNRREGVLERVLGAPTVAEPAKRKSEQGAGVPAVELVERDLTPVADQLDQFAVGGLRSTTTGGVPVRGVGEPRSKG